MGALFATAGFAEHPDALPALLLPIVVGVIAALIVFGSRLARGLDDRAAAGTERTGRQVAIIAVLGSIGGSIAWLGLFRAPGTSAVLVVWGILTAWYVWRPSWSSVFVHCAGPGACLVFVAAVVAAGWWEGTSPHAGIELDLFTSSCWLSGLVSFPVFLLMVSPPLSRSTLGLKSTSHPNFPASSDLTDGYTFATSSAAPAWCSSKITTTSPV